jgi:hypothetical protein
MRVQEMMNVRSCTTVFIGIALLMAACANKRPEATAVADQFIREYFLEDNVAGAAKLASGMAKTTLEGVIQQIEAAGMKEPPKDQPRVKITLMEKRDVSGVEQSGLVGHTDYCKFDVADEIPGWRNC